MHIDYGNFLSEIYSKLGDKNKEQQMNDNTKSRNKETVSEEHKQILNKT